MPKRAATLYRTMPDLLAAVNARAPRNRTKAIYIIETWVEPTEGHCGFWDALANPSNGVPRTFPETAVALRHIRENKVIGRLRIIAVKRVLTVVERQTTTLEIT
jgi:hypothetical protein